MALSPWPTGAPEIAAAVTILKQVLPATLTDERVAQLGATAAAVIEDYAPAGPQNVRDQCVEMFAGYVAAARLSPLTELKAVSIDLKYEDTRPNLSNAFRLCGAQGLLTRWKVRRGGVV